MAQMSRMFRLLPVLAFVVVFGPIEPSNARAEDNIRIDDIRYDFSANEQYRAVVNRLQVTYGPDPNDPNSSIPTYTWVPYGTFNHVYEGTTPPCYHVYRAAITGLQRGTTYQVYVQKWNASQGVWNAVGSYQYTPYY